MPRRRKKTKKTKRKTKGAGLKKKIALGVAGLGLLSVGLTGLQIGNSGLGKAIGRNIANRPHFAVPGYKWGN